MSDKLISPILLIERDESDLSKQLLKIKIQYDPNEIDYISYIKISLTSGTGYLISWNKNEENIWFEDYSNFTIDKEEVISKTYDYIEILTELSVSTDLYISCQLIGKNGKQNSAEIMQTFSDFNTRIEVAKTMSLRSIAPSEEPNIELAVYDCNDSCAGSCGGDCHTGCEDGCGDGCTNDCEASCADGCSGSCGDTCETGCSKDCTDSCYGVCEDDCTQSCADDCHSGCENSCGDGCTDGCEASCADGCTGDCGNTCETGCADGCSGDCGNTCETGCADGCSSSCSSDCTGNCKGGCLGSCSKECANDCTQSCASDCHTECTQECSGDCTQSCADDCHAGCKGGCEDNCASSCLQDCTGACKGTCVNNCTSVSTTDTVIVPSPQLSYTVDGRTLNFSIDNEAEQQEITGIILYKNGEPIGGLSYTIPDDEINETLDFYVRVEYGLEDKYVL